MGNVFIPENWSPEKSCKSFILSLINDNPKANKAGSIRILTCLVKANSIKIKTLANNDAIMILPIKTIFFKKCFIF